MNKLINIEYIVYTLYTDLLNESGINYLSYCSDAAAVLSGSRTAASRKILIESGEHWTYDSRLMN
jgi:hypothetical protein